MTDIREHFDIQVNLKTAKFAALGFPQLHLVDSIEVPVDMRVVISTASSYVTDFNNGSAAYKYATAFFGQDLRPSQLLTGRWVSQNIAAAFVWGPGMTKDFAVWALITNGKIQFSAATLPAPTTVNLTGIDFSAVTAMSQVADVINARLAALVAPAITGLELAEILIDKQGRFYLQMPGSVAGDGNPSVVMQTVAGAGTDLAPLMDTANGITVAAQDAETLTEAAQAITAKYEGWYIITPSALVADYKTQIKDLCAYCQAQGRIAHILSNEATAKTVGNDTDLGSVVRTLGYNRTMMFYSEKTSEHIQAASAGRVLPAPAGKLQWSWQILRGVTHSGATNELTTTEHQTLMDKGYNVVRRITAGSFLYPGLMAEGEEMRIMIGRDWFTGTIANSMAVDQLNAELMAFDNPTMAIAYKNIDAACQEALSRRIIVNTPKRPISINLPDEDEFTSDERGSHKVTVDDAFSCYINSAVNDWKLTGNWIL